MQKTFTEPIEYTENELEMLALAEKHGLPTHINPKGKKMITLAKMQNEYITPSYDFLKWLDKQQSDQDTCYSAQTVKDNLYELWTDYQIDTNAEVKALCELSADKEEFVKQLIRDYRSDKNKKHQRTLIEPQQKYIYAHKQLDKKLGYEIITVNRTSYIAIDIKGVVYQPKFPKMNDNKAKEEYLKPRNILTYAEQQLQGILPTELQLKKQKQKLNTKK